MKRDRSFFESDSNTPTHQEDPVDNSDDQTHSSESSSEDEDRMKTENEILSALHSDDDTEWQKRYQTRYLFMESSSDDSDAESDDAEKVMIEEPLIEHLDGIDSLIADEIMVYEILFCLPPRDVLNVRLVSKRYDEMICSKWLLHNDSKLIHRVGGGRMASANYVYISHFPNSGFKKYYQHFVNVKNMVLNNAWCAYLLKDVDFTRLECLGLFGGKLDGSHIELLSKSSSLVNVKHLSFVGNILCDDANLKTLINTKVLPKLITLNLNDNQLTDECIEVFEMYNYVENHQLRSLKIQGNLISIEGIKRLKQLKFLEYLDVSFQQCTYESNQEQNTEEKTQISKFLEFDEERNDPPFVGLNSGENEKTFVGSYEKRIVESIYSKNPFREDSIPNFYHRVEELVHNKWFYRYPSPLSICQVFFTKLGKEYSTNRLMKLDSKIIRARMSSLMHSMDSAKRLYSKLINLQEKDLEDSDFGFKSGEIVKEALRFLTIYSFYFDDYNDFIKIEKYLQETASIDPYSQFVLNCRDRTCLSRDNLLYYEKNCLDCSHLWVLLAIDQNNMELFKCYIDIYFKRQHLIEHIDYKISMFAIEHSLKDVQDILLKKSDLGVNIKSLLQLKESDSNSKVISTLSSFDIDFLEQAITVLIKGTNNPVIRFLHEEFKYFESLEGIPLSLFLKVQLYLRNYKELSDKIELSKFNPRYETIIYQLINESFSIIEIVYTIATLGGNIGLYLVECFGKEFGVFTKLLRSYSENHLERITWYLYTYNHMKELAAWLPKVESEIHYLVAGRAHYKLGNTTEAMTYLAKGPSNNLEPVSSVLIEIYCKLGKYDEVLKIIPYDLTCADSLIKISTILLHRGKVEDRRTALAYLEIAQHLQTDFNHSQYLMIAENYRVLSLVHDLDLSPKAVEFMRKCNHPSLESYQQIY